MEKLTRAIIGLLLLPVCYGAGRGLWSLGQRFREVPEGSFYFFFGFVLYLGFQWAFFRPIRTYVFGHELTHALAGWISGARVKKFEVKKTGGSVALTKTNLFIALAPYVIPLYTLLLGGLLAVVRLWVPLEPVWPWVLGALGGTMAFHLSLTVYALKQKQPDLKAGGTVLSAVVIFLGNAIVVVLLGSLLFPRTTSWQEFVRQTGEESWKVYGGVARGAVALWKESRHASSMPR